MQEQMPAQAQPQPQAQPAPQPAPQGAMAPEGGAAPEVQQVLAGFQEHLASLPQEQAELVSEHMTPEMTQILGIIFGPEVGEFFNQFADPSIILVPVEREAFMAEVQAGQQGGQQTPAPVPESPSGDMGPMA